MSRKILYTKVEELGKAINKLNLKIEKHLTEFVIYKKFITKIGSAILIGIIGILVKLFWKSISTSPTIIANVVASLNNVTP